MVSEQKAETKTSKSLNFGSCVSFFCSAPDTHLMEPVVVKKTPADRQEEEKSLHKRLIFSIL